MPSPRLPDNPALVRPHRRQRRGSASAIRSAASICPTCDILVVSDLHLEKGSAFARRGMMLPPYDTLATLRILDAVIARHDPKTVISLGDNFHDRVGSALMPDALPRA